MILYKTITDLHSEWQALHPLKLEDEKRLWKKLRLEWNYHSNHIEGNTLTYGETATLLIHDQAVGNHDLRNYVEMKAHDLAIEHLRSMVSEDRPLTETDVRDLNRILLKESFWKDAITPEGQATRIEILPGEYKQQPNNVRTADGDVFAFAAPADVHARMKSLLDDYAGARESGDEHPVVIAAKLHHEFVLIHPFGDGNGRTARLLVNYVLMRAGYPPIIVPSPEKDRYLAALRQADAGDMAPLCEYLAVCTERALTRAIAAGNGESIEEPDDLDKEIEVFKKRQRRSEKEVVRKSADALRLAYRHSLKPLFEEFVATYQKFDDLFKESEIILLGVENSEGANWLERIEKAFEGPSAEKMGHIGIIYELRVFSGVSETAFSTKAMLGLYFEEYQYRFERINRDIPAMQYDVHIPESERKGIIKELQSMTFREIKSQCPSE